ncbi:MAG: ParB N-terminal domain-containing protein [Fimbriimonadaceae bacterium]|nr:ParB N-terminal domain-containing protein [Fimbriimonadaceae bacterium]
MQIKMVPCAQINPAPYNPRKDLQPGDPEYERLRKSLDEFGCVEPLVWNKRTGHLVGGHQRFKVLLAQGMKSAQVSVVDLPLEREKALNLALNKITGAWDQTKLAELLDELIHLPDFDITLTGFDVPEARDLIAEVLGDEQPESFDVEAEIAAAHQRKPVTKPGEMLSLGQHRLLCGDCTDAKQVRKLIKEFGTRAILFSTDPPYLVGYDGMNHPASKRRAGVGSGGSRESGVGKKTEAAKSSPSPPKADANKDWSGTYGVTWDDFDANPDLYDKFIAVAIAEAISTDAAWYCWHASRRQAMLEEVWVKHGAFVHQQIIWCKDRSILTRSWYSWQHEPCLMGWVRPNKPPRRAVDVLPSVWQVPTVPVGAPTEHPTSKPLQLFEIPIRQHTLPNELIYEPFCGSGSQLIAAERLGRRCAAIEISPVYCDVIVRRWIATVGEGKAPAELVKRYKLEEPARSEAA